MLRIAVLDDQKEYLTKVESITDHCLTELHIPYELKLYTSPEELLLDIDVDNKYDIFLLDVEMPDTTGLKVAKAIKEKYFYSVIIYITNHVEYAVAAYETNAYRYIPKKLLEEKLPEAYQAIYPELKNRKKEYYVIEKNHKLEKIAYEDIYCIKKDGKNILIVHKHGTSSERKTLTEFYDSLKDFLYFIMVDRSYIVNILYVQTLKNQQISLSNGEVIPVSRPKLSYVKKEILRVWKK